MGKLNFLLAEDYIKPKIYFKSKQAPIVNTSYSFDDQKQFEGLDHLTQLLCSPKGFIVNAFQIDYYQSLPRLISKSLRNVRSYKKLYILGPELSLSILKRSAKTLYEKQYQDYEYINVEQDSDQVTQQCLTLLKEGHILYVLPEASVCWQPAQLENFQKTFSPLCSTLLSQQAEVPILATASDLESEKVTLYHPDFPENYTGKFGDRIEQQSEAIYNLLEAKNID